MKDKSIFIVIPIHNRKEFTYNCLLSLRGQTVQNFKIIIIDDGSTDGTSEMIRKKFPDVTLLHGDGHLWWTGAINVGIKYVLKTAKEGDVILLLNDDLIVENNYLCSLLEATEKRPNSIIGSVEVTTEAPDIIECGGVVVNWITAKQRVLHRGEKLSLFGKKHFEQTSILSGRGTLYPISVFKKVGFFDDKHFKQCGDTELPRRAFLKGYSLYICYDAMVKTRAEDKGTININNKSKYALSDIFKYYFDTRSNYCLKYRWYFSRSVSNNAVACLVYFLFDVSRITYHFFSSFNIS